MTADRPATIEEAIEQQYERVNRRGAELQALLDEARARGRDGSLSKELATARRRHGNEQSVLYSLLHLRRVLAESDPARG